MNKRIIFFGVIILSLTSCQKPDLVIEKPKTQYINEHEEMTLSYREALHTLDSATEEQLLKKIKPKKLGKSSSHVTLPQFPKNSTNAKRMEKLQSLLIENDLRESQIHLSKRLTKHGKKNKILIKINYYQVIPPQCDNTYEGYGHHRCAFENNMVMMIQDPVVFFDTSSEFNTRAVEDIAAIKKYESETFGNKEEKTANKPDIAGALGSLLGGALGTK